MSDFEIQRCERKRECENEIERLRHEAEYARIQLSEARLEERQAMAYLSTVRKLVGGQNCPDMIERVRVLQAELDAWKGLAAQFSNELDALKAGVPNAKNLGDHKSAAYVLGWNECRCAMLTAPKPGEQRKLICPMR
jgi:hypothetical protein